MIRCEFIRVLTSIVFVALKRADRAIGAGYMFATFLGYAHATIAELRFGRVWCAVLEREVDVNLVAAGFAE